jgi:hypothetical protein
VLGVEKGVRMTKLVKVIARRSEDPIIHLAESDSKTTLCGRRAVWDVREKYVRATCPECKARS